MSNVKPVVTYRGRSLGILVISAQSSLFYSVYTLVFGLLTLVLPLEFGWEKIGAGLALLRFPCLLLSRMAWNFWIYRAFLEFHHRRQGSKSFTVFWSCFICLKIMYESNIKYLNETVLIVLVFTGQNYSANPNFSLFLRLTIFLCEKYLWTIESLKGLIRIQNDSMRIDGFNGLSQGGKPECCNKERGSKA